MKKIWLLLLVLYAISTQAQINPLPTPATIEVVGTAEIKVLPDEIFIQFTLKEKTVNREKISIRQQEEKLLTALNGIGVGPHQISFTDQSTSYERVSWRKREAITEKEFRIKVRDSRAVGQVFEELEKLDIQDAEISHTHHTRMDSLTKVVQIQAMKKAKEKADYMLAALGELTGKVLSVVENPVSPSDLQTGNAVFINGIQQFPTSIPSSSNLVQIQKVVLTSSILVRFLIK